MSRRMADEEPAPRPECFGSLEKVFPRGADGLRHSPEGCLACGDKTECLRAAVSGEQGVAVHEERIERAWRSGSTGFLERWSQKKALNGRRRREGILARLARFFNSDRGHRGA